MLTSFQHVGGWQQCKPGGLGEEAERRKHILLRFQANELSTGSGDDHKEAPPMLSCGCCEQKVAGWLSSKSIRGNAKGMA